MWDTGSPMDFKEAKKAIEGNSIFPESLDNFGLLSWQMIQKNLLNLRKSQISFILVPCKSAKEHFHVWWYQAFYTSHWGLWQEATLLELGTTCKKGTCGKWTGTHMDRLISMGDVCYFWGFFHAAARLWEFSSAVCPASLGSMAAKRAPAQQKVHNNKKSSTMVCSLWPQVLLSKGPSTTVQV